MKPNRVQPSTHYSKWELKSSQLGLRAHSEQAVIAHDCHNWHN